MVVISLGWSLSRRRDEAPGDWQGLHVGCGCGGQGVCRPSGRECVCACLAVLEVHTLWDQEAEFPSFNLEFLRLPLVLCVDM